MTELRMTFKSRRHMSDGLMDQIMAYGEHLGLMMGGTWSKEKLVANFFPYAHPAECCDKTPSPGRITPKIKAALGAWLEKRGVKYEWRRGRW